jgi:peptide/nickel transport system substrate-binding protein
MLLEEGSMKIDDVLTALSGANVRVSRRDLLRLAALGSLAAGAGGLATLGGPTTRVHAAPKKGGVWRMALPGNPTAYPITTPGRLVDILVNKVIFDTLVHYQLKNGAIELAPDLAESWTANRELTEYTFKLRKGVKWHDGQPFSAEDVKFTIDAQLDPKVNAAFTGTVSAIARTEVIDPTTVRFVLKAPSAVLPVMLGYNIAIVPKHLLAGQDLNQPVDFLRRPVGTGPFKFKSFSQGNYLETEANRDYFGGAPMLDGIVFKVIPDGNARLAQLRAGEIDFTVIEPAQVAALGGTSTVEVRRAPQVNYNFIAINHSDPRFRDVRVRQALAYAIDKQAIVKNILRGDAQVATGPINPLLGEFYNPKVQTYEYNPDRAKALLEEAGWKKGADGVLQNAKGERLTLSLNGPKGYPVIEQVLTYAQEQYQRIGAAPTLDIMDWPVHLERYHKRQYDLLMQWWITPPDPDLYDHYYSESKNNWWAYKNPEIDDLVVKARSEPDRKKRIALYHRIQEILAKDVPIIYLYYPHELQGMARRTHEMPLMGYRDALTWMVKVWVE